MDTPFTVLTICAFRVLNPDQWSLTKNVLTKTQIWSKNILKYDQDKRNGVNDHKVYTFYQFNFKFETLILWSSGTYSQRTVTVTKVYEIQHRDFKKKPP